MQGDVIIVCSDFSLQCWGLNPECDTFHTNALPLTSTQTLYLFISSNLSFFSMKKVFYFNLIF